MVTRRHRINGKLTLAAVLTSLTDYSPHSFGCGFYDFIFDVFCVFGNVIQLVFLDHIIHFYGEVQPMPR